MGKLSLEMTAGPDNGRLLMQPVPGNSKCYLLPQIIETSSISCHIFKEWYYVQAFNYESVLDLAITSFLVL